MTTPDYQKPMKTDLLWVYQGMTQYWGIVLAARSGLETPEDFREHLAELGRRSGPPSGPRLASASRHGGHGAGPLLCDKRP